LDGLFIACDELLTISIYQLSLIIKYNRATDSIADGRKDERDEKK
jgi:hypothetical protein